jgi:hypothetical protein
LQTKNLKKAVTALISMTLLACASCSSTSNNQPVAPAENVLAGHGRIGSVTETNTRTAIVEAVDVDRRNVTLRYPDGTVAGYFCRPEVRNIGQIKIGDKVTLTNTKETIVALGKGGRLPGTSAPTGIERAPEGAKPGGKIVDAIDFSGKIVEVDARNREVILHTGAAGVLKAVKVNRDVNLSMVKRGDDAEVRITQVTTIAVETP